MTPGSAGGGGGRGRAEIDLRDVRTVPFHDIPRKVTVGDFAPPFDPEADPARGLPSLPSILAARDFHALIERILEARRRDRPVVVMFGAHVIKCGLSRILIDLVERGLVTALATNGAGAIHDYEIALFGATSEDVETGLATGVFGMSEETGAGMNGAIREAASRGDGLGAALGARIREEKAPHAAFSLLAAAVGAEIPVTVHVAIGTDVIHQHPACDGASIGATSHEDFRRFCGVVADLEGGVVLNLGSAVILPEVFLKALCVARNLGHRVEVFTAADFDMVRRYRPAKNVLERPVAGGGSGFAFTGHHEILVPLLAAELVRASLDKSRESG